MSQADTRFMALALELAGHGRGLTSPNPMVGALVVQGEVIVGRGWHRGAGQPHAEAVALAEAGDRSRGATLYVTLEPCSHHGRTPPCTDAILRAGVRRVVAAVRDPNPRVAGGGGQRLAVAGLDVTLGCLATDAEALNRVFFTAMAQRRPHVTLKTAMSLDGKIAAADGTSRWITGESARCVAHRLRAESDAVVVGIGTALTDDPALTVRRDPPWPREPYRVVVDSHARLPANARVIHAGTASRAVVAVGEDAPADRVAALAASGATVVPCKSRGGRVDVEDLARRLFEMDVLAVLLEGGATLAWAFVDAGLVDRAAVFVAPLLLGGAAAPTPVGGTGRSLAGALRLGRLSAREIGGDWLLEADVLRGTDGGSRDNRPGDVRG
jgi:diaminohydroxyphosphoribosylaminopyrimidine deaminase/5-amino-6-(5-phosphoribosylamino)uracil reductase